MLVFKEHLLYVPDSVLGQENRAINRASVILVLKDDPVEILKLMHLNEFSSNEHTGYPFTVTLVFALGNHLSVTLRDVWGWCSWLLEGPGHPFLTECPLYQFSEWKTC